MYFLFCFTKKTFQWTTDSDIYDAIQSVGVQDIVEVRFFENRANGQSKGFCLVTLASDSSVRAVLDKLPKKYVLNNF